MRFQREQSSGYDTGGAGGSFASGFTGGSSCGGQRGRTAHRGRSPPPGAAGAAADSPHWRSEDPFVCLELPRGAGPNEAKRHYRKLCLLYHPDKSKHPNATEAFVAITQAYRRIAGES